MLLTLLLWFRLIINDVGDLGGLRYLVLGVDLKQGNVNCGFSTCLQSYDASSSACKASKKSTCKLSRFLPAQFVS